MKRILVMGSRKTIEKITTCITNNKFHVFTAHFIEEGFFCLHEKHIELLVLDGFIADVDGVEIMKEVRNLYPTLPVITVTSDLLTSGNYR